ncbi:unnamed protein product [Brassica rapa]|uniref:GATA-type domain-containing protein n=1 Tax=Brassica campestris TaxID=3711 RepID=A0A8D9G5S0_BRACM|nr:unnamed protein product [Brassica rapa]
MRMNPISKLALVWLTLLGSVLVSFAELEFGHCERVVKEWADTSSSREEHPPNIDKRSLQDLLFFLHVPRTGGRTYFHCFLRKLYDNSEECPRSYDKLHFDPRKQKCKLLATHDDYSLMSKLPRERTSVMTIVRDPVARVLSTYEFSVEVAARFLVHPNLTSATRMSGRIRKNNVISTLDIWPWKYLVPWMREDLFARRDARKLKGVVIIEDDNPYDMEEMLMPLHKYLDTPTAHDIIHNGATFQIAGLTNNSRLSEAHEVRHCVQKYRNLGEPVLQVAKRRLDSMLYVGLTEEHRESASLFANVVGSQVLSQLVTSNATAKTKTTKSEASVTVSESGSDKSEIQNGTSEVASNKIEAKSGNMTVKTLMEVYEGCITHLRKSQGTRRVNSLKRISPANFTRGTRTRVPNEVIQQIKSLNNLDVELYKYAKEIFVKEHELVSKKMVSTVIMNWLPEEEFKGLSDNFFDDFINHIDFPLEDIDTTNGEGDWDAKFKELEPPPMDMFTSFPSEFNSCGVASKDGIKKNVSVLKQSDASAALSGINDTLHQSSSHHDVKVSKLFQSSSPVSVLESSDGSFSPQNSTSQRLTFPVKGLRSKRKRPTTLRRRHLYPFEPEKLTPEESESSEQHAKKKRKIFTTNHTVSSSSEGLNSDGVVRRCTHCETTKTPQWREGPTGPKTLCNACGVRFRSGRLVPEYRPASSPTFIPSVHSNSHRKIVEMRSREGDQFDKRAV